jgi:hypothetical protein
VVEAEPVLSVVTGLETQAELEATVRHRPFLDRQSPMLAAGAGMGTHLLGEAAPVVVAKAEPGEIPVRLDLRTLVVVGAVAQAATAAPASSSSER